MGNNPDLAKGNQLGIFLLLIMFSREAHLLLDIMYDSNQTTPALPSAGEHANQLQNHFAKCL